MLKRSWLLCGLAVTVLLSSCLFDPEENKDPGDPPAPPIEEMDLTLKWHVLNNIVYAYQNRNSGPTVYDELLDENFTFHFAPGDVGGEIPAQWGRTDELSSTTNLFQSNSGNPQGPVCRSMRLDLEFDPESMTWAEKIPECCPSEVWYSTTVFYSFVFEMEPDNTYIPFTGAKAEFTVRDDDPSAAEHWVLVEFRDLATGN